ncbi:MAG: SRPBCC domain-containing protein [Bacteroidota bacterium]|nr:SRPBCC domain-containing protein [Bacteroidota bacterium]MDP4246561.1 SRPBCC domain-containing protein [Bacteroidota bacterium]MDP4260434.1 SRPBCC domain-containing protein [Bacteroidota bacterium]
MGEPQNHSLPMADILQCFPINAPASRVFGGISSSKGLDQWWTKSSKAEPEAGGTYSLDFGPQYIWKAIVTKYSPDRELEWQLIEADADWLGTRIGFVLSEKGGRTDVEFYHTGWPEPSLHYRISTYCWAMYLRILKRWLEFGEQVPYEKRLSV